ncbi:hypothetical protein ACOME3_004771 [Neoechinorhynchus agilis]
MNAALKKPRKRSRRISPKPSFGHYAMSKLQEVHNHDSNLQFSEIHQKLYSTWKDLPGEEKDKFIASEALNPKYQTKMTIITEYVEKINFPRAKVAPLMPNFINVFSESFVKTDHEREEQFRKLKSSVRQVNKKIVIVQSDIEVALNVLHRIERLCPQRESELLSACSAQITTHLKKYVKRFPVSNPNALRNRIRKMKLSDEQKTELRNVVNTALKCAN